MADHNQLRKLMVEQQLISRGIRSPLVLDTFFKVERHKFLPKESLNSAYGDFPLPIGEGQTISQPYIVALMTELLSLDKGAKVLEIGTGSGYQTAILCELAKEVYSIERLEDLAKTAEKILTELGYHNFIIKTADGTLGLPEYAPFDRILITASAPQIPSPLIEQLKEGGILVLPLGENAFQTLTVVRKIKKTFVTQDICGCIFVPLIGKYAWEE